MFMCPAKHTAGKISKCPDWKFTCPVGHVTTKVYVPWDKIYMPRARGHALMSSPEQCWNVVNWTLKNQLQWNFNRNSYIFIEENFLKISPGKQGPFHPSLNVLTYPVYGLTYSKQPTLIALLLMPSSCDHQSISMFDWQLSLRVNQ